MSTQRRVLKSATERLWTLAEDPALKDTAVTWTTFARAVYTALHDTPEGVDLFEIHGKYRHPHPSDLVRLRAKANLDNEADAQLLALMCASLRITVVRHGETCAIERKGNYLRLCVAPEKVRFDGRKIELFREDREEPFHRVVGRFLDGVRVKPETDEALRKSDLYQWMAKAGWNTNHPAIQDENGVVLVGHRRLRIARILGIEPIIHVIKFGQGVEADNKRIKLIVNSNLGGKSLTPDDKAALATYLYNDIEWDADRVRQALGINTDEQESSVVPIPNRAGINRVALPPPPPSVERRPTAAMNECAEDDPARLWTGEMTPEWIRLLLRIKPTVQALYFSKERR